MKKIILVTGILLYGVADANAQPVAVAGKTIILSAIKGKASKPDTIMLPSTVSAVKSFNGDKSFFRIASYKRGKLVLVFEPDSGFIGIAKTKLLGKNAAGRVIAEINCTGLSTKGLEGENEPTLATVAEALGYKINIGWTSLANHSRPEMQGDEISNALFHKAGKGKVEIIPVARYSPDFELPFGYYIDTAASPELHQVGVLAKTGAFPEHQCLFPSLAAGSRFFDPGQHTFGFYATGPTHTAYSEDVWNMLIYPANAVHATRIYPLKDTAGKSISNTFLLCFEEAKNGDYNDYVFIVKNISPLANDLFIPLFNGKNLDGWHTFLKNTGTNADPDTNFIIENNSLHVVGKDLGYAMTDKSFSNFHFKVEFKWGERRWGSRTKEKRDAGVCYNIPANEPDSIWPQSIECQIQEGDVGDFWLLGFSTIKVGGIQNVAANHTRMIKQKDGEKPYGEWNTVEIISKDGKCVQVVNGIVVNAGEEASVKEGRILLQSEYAEIYYRNVKLRKL